MAAILGISIGNSGSAACLTIDGFVRAAGREEIFSRRRADNSFPIKSIQHCLQTAGIDARDLAYVSVADKPYLRLDRELMAHIESWPSGLSSFLHSHEGMLSDKLFLNQRVRKAIGIRKPIIFCHPHEAMAAFAMWKSKLDDCAILVVDDGRLPSAVTAFSARGDELKAEFFLPSPHSPWCFWQAFSDCLGPSMRECSSPKEERYTSKLEQFMRMNADGSLSISPEFFDLSARLAKLKIGRAEKALGLKKGEIAGNTALASEVQRYYERSIRHLASSVAAKTNSRTLLVVGIGTTGMRNIPAVGDGSEPRIISYPGIICGQESAGAALFAHENLLKQKPGIAEFRPQHLAGQEESGAFLDRAGIIHEPCSEEELIHRLERYLAQGDTVAWMEGRADIFQFQNQLLLGSEDSPKWRSLKSRLGLTPSSAGLEISPLLQSILSRIEGHTIQIAGFESEAEPAPARPQDAYRFFLSNHLDWLVVGKSIVRKRNCS